MKIVIAGGAGFVGTAIIRALAASGHEAIGIAIEASDTPKIIRAGGQPLVADLGTPEGLAVLRRAALAADGVVNAIKVCRRTDVKEVDPDPARREHEEGLASLEWERVNLAIIETVLDSYAGTGKVYLHNNSAVSIGDMGTRIADESTVPETPGYYGHWQTQHEQMVLAAASRGIRTVSLRSGMIFGPHPNGLPLGRPHPANMHQQLWEDGAVGYLGDGSAISTGVHVDDFAELFICALDRAPAGEMFIGGGVDYTRKELALALSHAYGYGGKIRGWTWDEAKAVLGDGKMLAFLDDNHRTTSAKAIRMLGWAPKAPGLVEFGLMEEERLYVTGGLPRPWRPELAVAA